MAQPLSYKRWPEAQLRPSSCSPLPLLMLFWFCISKVIYQMSTASIKLPKIAICQYWNVIIIKSNRRKRKLACVCVCFLSLTRLDGFWFKVCKFRDVLDISEQETWLFSFTSWQMTDLMWQQRRRHDAVVLRWRWQWPIIESLSPLKISSMFLSAIHL